jgi:Protein of unknown function (DUF3179)
VSSCGDGTPVTVTYCPLCNSAVAYDRRLGDRVLEFGTSGLLYNSALIMYGGTHPRLRVGRAASRPSTSPSTTSPARRSCFGEAAAVRLDALAADGVEELDLGSEQPVAWVVGGTSSALDASTVSGGRDVGATGVFFRVVDGRELSFEANGDGFVDQQTGNSWNVFGEATEGRLAGTQLDAVPHVDTFWFAWAAFRPDTTIVG